MIQIDVQQAQAELPHYLEQVAKGETIVVCKDNQPIAEIRAILPQSKEPRPLGLAKGMGEIHPSFFDPLPDDLLALFNGEGVMNLLLDTCTFLWIALDPSRLSVPATQAFTDPANTCWLSSVSAWEIAVKYGLGQISLQVPPEQFVPQQRALHGINPLPLLEAEALHVTNLPRVHKDPFDRMLVCQAILRNMVILTPDPLIQQYPVQTMW